MSAKPDKTLVGFRYTKENALVAGEWVTVYNASEAGIDGGKYAAVCECHSSMICTGQLGPAIAAMHNPKSFCEECRAIIERGAIGEIDMSEKVYEVLAKTNQKLNNALDELERAQAEIDRQQSALSAIAEIARTDGGAELKDTPVAAWDKVLKLASGGAEVSE